MPGVLESWILPAALIVGVVVPGLAWAVRGGAYAAFAAVVLGLSLPGAVIGHARCGSLFEGPFAVAFSALFLYGIVSTGIHMAHLAWARLRGGVFRYFVSVPGQTFAAAGFMAGVWMLLLLPLRGAFSVLGFESAIESMRWLELVPFGVAVVSVVTSLRPSEEWVRIPLDPIAAPATIRLPVERRRRAPRSPAPGGTLRVVQITDPHLGPWQPTHRLRRHIERLLVHDPDLVLLTGDFLTMEGNGSRGALAESLAPLAPIAERCFAIFGNHDHESPEEVRGALAANGITLLVDDEAIVETPMGRVQILGADYVGRRRAQHIVALAARYPRRPNHLRLLLLHDPLGFQYVPDGAADLTLSGHTHGGQVGLVSFGLDWTVLKHSRWPDHGLFARGTNRLYVHRGTGFYGFPLRVGVPGELSVLELVPDA